MSADRLSVSMTIVFVLLALVRVGFAPSAYATQRGIDAHHGFAPSDYPSLEGSAVDYLIVTADALAAEYQRLADWKTAKGVPTVVRTLEWIVAHTRNGVDVQETLRFFIRDAHTNWGIRYVLLGGDTDLLPPRYAFSAFLFGGSEIPADIYFACLDGSWNENHNDVWGEVPDDRPDLLAEVYLGRVSLSNPAEVSSFVDKIMSYERADQSAYTDRLVGMAEVLFPIGWNEGDPISLNGADIMETLLTTRLAGVPLDIVRMYESETLFAGSVDLNKQAALDSLSAGFNHVVHVGAGFRFNVSMGDASILNADVATLTNAGRPSNLYVVGNKGGSMVAFDFDCIAERFLRHPNGGAISVIGPAGLGTPPLTFSNYMYDYYGQVFQKDVVHIGRAFWRMKALHAASAMATDGGDTFVHYSLTLLGEPEMPLFTHAVEIPTVQHVANVDLGVQPFLVRVMVAGSPVDSAVVCLSKGDEDYQIGRTDNLGLARVEFTAQSPGSIRVVVSGRNLARRQSYIAVDPAPGAYVSLAVLTVDDDTLGGTFGNGDGVVDAGETVDFTPSLMNTGGALSGPIAVLLRTGHASATVVDSTATGDPVAVGATVAALDPVRVHFDAGFADGTVVEFELELSDGANTWNDIFRKKVHAPQLRLIALRIDDDPPLGDGDGIVGDSEQFLLFYEIKNYGTGAANALTADVVAPGGVFVLTRDTDTYIDLQAFDAAENVSGFHIAETDTTAEHDLKITITDLFGRTYCDTIELRPPASPGSLAADRSFGSDRIELTWAESPSADVLHYGVHRSTTSGGPYAVANIDPIEHALLLDTGLSPNTRFYYVVTAIDASGNRSLPSAELAATTTAPQTDGFPVGVASESSSSPAIGDIDGDGDLEIVVGSDKIYAWHHGGGELRDGDGDPSTSGVLTVAGGEFTAAITLAHLDSDPGLEIIAADVTTNSVYCMKGDGTSLPGWPQTAENGFRAAPVVGDLDGDGTPEIIAVDSKGVVYAWCVDGSEYRDGDNDPGTSGVFYRTPVTSFHYQTPTLCDLDGDGADEIIVPTRVDTIYALNGDGTFVPGWPFAASGELAGSVAAGDVDNDSLPELVAHARTSEVYLLNHDGTLAPGWPRFVPVMSFFASSPALADLDADDMLEIVIVGSNGVEGNVYVIDYTGLDRPGWPRVLSETFNESSPVVVDIDGLGYLDVVLGDESGTLHAWDSAGRVIEGFPMFVGDAIRATPFLTDVDLDGDIDMVVHSWDRSIYVYDLPGYYDATRSEWPTFQANIHRNGKHGLLVEPVTPPVDPPPSPRAVLLQNFPNPFNPGTRIEYAVAGGTTRHVSLIIYDVTGARVRRLVNGPKSPVRHTAFWDGTNDAGGRVASGLYLYRLEQSGFTATRKMILLR